MLKKVTKFYNQIVKYTLAIFLVIFFIFTIVTILYQGMKGKFDSLSFISIVAIALSFPGIVHTLAEEVNPMKKTYKLSCKCPSKHLIQMGMKEE
ncbi:hypothetical protein [Psychrobacillus sp. FSL K6-1415]|uniref:hypothetical protein n=1 Tax=Psychrobacillus sp. FSL K6-1415 TaxID=2921544 RepID=UPI0030F7D2C7